ncbi:MAG: TolC family protein [Candidatus Zixiibacteriota bacterium]
MKRVVVICGMAIGSLLTAAGLQSRDLTLDQALDLAVNRTARGSVIRGNLEVAEQNYFAKRVNFYVPEIKLEGSLPSYSEDKSYRGVFGFKGRGLYTSTDFGLTSDISLKQSLIFGGDFTVRANLTKRDEKYPDSDTLGNLIYPISYTKQGSFSFSYAQPLLKPSESKYELHNRRDDYEIARFTRIEEEGKLRKEVIEAYVGVLQTELRADLARVKFESSRLKTAVDSAKLADGVIAEEKFLETSSLKLDNELNHFDMENQLAEKRRQMAILLDLDASDTLRLFMPETLVVLGEATRRSLQENWSSTVSIRQAEYRYKKAKRAADYAASAHGLSGDLAANYSFGRGKVDVDGTQLPDINTNSWTVALNFTFPIWDGGASGASVKAARLAEESSRLEFEKAQKAAKAEIESLLNRLDVSHRKLAVIRQQIGLAQNKLDIAQKRFDNGEISDITLLDAQIFFLQTKDKYLDELRNFLVTRLDLESKFSG